MKTVFLYGCGLVLALLVGIGLLFGGLAVSGVYDVFQTQINRNVVTNSQQYITSINTALLNYQEDYSATTDPNRQASIVNQFCHEAILITPDQINQDSSSFYVVHCH